MKTFPFPPGCCAECDRLAAIAEWRDVLEMADGDLEAQEVFSERLLALQHKKCEHTCGGSDA